MFTYVLGEIGEKEAGHALVERYEKEYDHRDLGSDTMGGHHYHMLRNIKQALSKINDEIALKEIEKLPLGD